jgi:dienelactone hydrolase
MTLDPKIYINERLAAVVRPVLERDELRRRLLAVIGNLQTWERPPLEPRVVETTQLDGYRREKMYFTSRPGLTVLGYFLTPDDIKTGERRPGVLCLPGHGSGVDSDIGILPDGRQLSVGESEEYHAMFSLQSVHQGYPTLAIEQIGFGERRQPSYKAQGPHHTSCHADTVAALMLGETTIGWRVWDAMRSLDYLQTRTEVDPARLVTMGISGGGLTSLFCAALDERVTACVVSGYLNTFADSVLSVFHCVDNYAPGLFELCEMEDIAALVAPRPLYAENGDADPIFPIAGFHKAVAATERSYEERGVPEKFRSNIFSGGHQFDGTGLWTFLQEQLA